MITFFVNQTQKLDIFDAFQLLNKVSALNTVDNWQHLLIQFLKNEVIISLSSKDQEEVFIGKIAKLSKDKLVIAAIDFVTFDKVTIEVEINDIVSIDLFSATNIMLKDFLNSDLVSRNFKKNS